MQARGGGYTRSAFDAISSADRFCAFVLTYQHANWFLVHAGIRPSIPLSEQIEDDLLWIANPLSYQDAIRWWRAYGPGCPRAHSAIASILMAALVPVALNEDAPAR